MRDILTRINNSKGICIWTIIIAMVLMSMIPSTTFAENSKYNSSAIPENMSPSTVIKYVNENEYIIVEGLNNTNDQNAKLSDAINFSDKAILPHEEYPAPEKNMVVYYGIDGQVNHIEFAQKNSEDKFTTLPSNQQKILDSYIENVSKESESITKDVKTRNNMQLNEVTAKASPYATWGSYPNKMYIIDGSRTRTGTGRATVYGDSKGQGNHTLKKGDVATKLKYDNCKLGLTVNVTMPKKGSSTDLTKQMKKWDAGGMPNAIVDIWKTGIEYWGFTYTSGSLSSWARGNTYIEHANNMI